MSDQGLNSFTPSMNDPQLLEEMFVGREPLLKDLVEGIRHASESGTMSYNLLIGPRGIGKTHIIALLNSRVFNDPELGKSAYIAWLQEDPWSIASYLDLLLAILRQLKETYAFPKLDAGLMELPRYDRDQAMAIAENLILETLDGRLLLIFAENLNDIFESIQEAGQRSFRAFLQNNERTSMVATSTSLLTPYVVPAERAFYGGFRVTTLKPFTREQAVEMLIKIAEIKKDHDLKSALDSRLGRTRVNAIHYLAGGNPRVYVIFYQFLTRESLDELVTPFSKMVNELTPYYQSRMQTLSSLQRKLVDIIRRADETLTVGELSKEAFTSQATVSKELSRLKETGYVMDTSSGREKYYELREPLMRLALDTKEARGTAVPLFVDFLRVWFTDPDLRDLLVTLDPQALEHRNAVKAALTKKDSMASMIQIEFSRSYPVSPKQAAEWGQDLLRRSPEQPLAFYMQFTVALRLSGQYDKQLDILNRSTKRFPTEPFFWRELCILYRDLNSFNEMIMAAEKAYGICPTDPQNQTLLVMANAAAGKKEKVLKLKEQFISILQEKGDINSEISSMIIHCFSQDFQQAINISLELIQQAPEQPIPWDYLHLCIEKMGYYHLATKLFFIGNKCISGGFDHFTLATFYSKARDIGKALHYIKKATEEYPMIPIWMTYIFILLSLRQAHEAMKICEKLEVKPEHHWCIAHILFGEEKWQEGQRDLVKWFRHAKKQDLVVGRFQDAMRVVLCAHSDPESWAPYVRVWIGAAKEADVVSEVGSALLKVFPQFGLSWLGLGQAKRWLELWKTGAKGIQALTITLKMLEAMIAFKGTGDIKTLLKLSRPERNLLQPLLDYYERFADPGFEDETIRRVNQVLAQLEVEHLPFRQQKIAQEAREQPDRKSLHKTLSTYRTNKKILHPLNPVLSTSPATLSKKEALLFLEKAFAEKSLFEDLLKSDFHIDRIDSWPLDFINGRLLQVHCQGKGFLGALDFIQTEKNLFTLDGKDYLGWINETRGESLKIDKGNVIEYLFTYSGMKRGERGRFEIATVRTPGLADAISAKEPQKVLPDGPEIVENNPSYFCIKTYIIYDNYLVKCNLRVFKMGYVDMLEGELILGPLNLPKESFRGPLRYFPKSKGNTEPA